MQKYSNKIRRSSVPRGGFTIYILFYHIYNRADTNNSFSDRQDSDDDSILDAEPTKLSFTESTEEKAISPQRRLVPRESHLAKESSSSSPIRYGTCKIC